MFKNEILYNYFEQCKGILTTISACNILSAYTYHNKELNYGRKPRLPERQAYRLWRVGIVETAIRGGGRDETSKSLPLNFVELAKRHGKNCTFLSEGSLVACSRQLVCRLQHLVDSSVQSYVMLLVCRLDMMQFKGVFFYLPCFRAEGQLHEEVILLQLPESFCLLFSFANQGFCFLNLSGIEKFKQVTKTRLVKCHQGQSGLKCMQ